MKKKTQNTRSSSASKIVGRIFFLYIFAFFLRETLCGTLLFSSVCVPEVKELSCKFWMSWWLMYFLRSLSWNVQLQKYSYAMATDIYSNINEDLHLHVSSLFFTRFFSGSWSMNMIKQKRIMITQVTNTYRHKCPFLLYSLFILLLTVCVSVWERILAARNINVWCGICAQTVNKWR